jgi:DNA-binding response OmpR family regulator
VLVVDDEEMVRRFVSLALIQAGYDVTVAAPICTATSWPDRCASDGRR